MTFESNLPLRGEAAATPAAGARLNNLSALRLLFAYSVVLSHAALLLGGDGHRLLRSILKSDVAVQGFFILSGGLVYASYERIGDWREFYRRRLARIYPAYGFAVCLFAALAVLQAWWFGRSVGFGEIVRYLAANLVTLNFLYPEITGTFDANPIRAVNGALWSIKVEMMYYASVPAIWCATRRLGVVPVAAAFIIIGAGWWPVVELVFTQAGREPPLSLRYQLPGQLHLFALGMALFARAQGQLSTAALLALAALAVAAFALAGDFEHVAYLIALLALIAAMTRLPESPLANTRQDFSYGIYLAHFPLIQLLVAGGIATALPFTAYLLLVTALAFAYGALSWTVIEKPALEWFAKGVRLARR